MSYGTYIKALSKAKKTKLNRGREKWNKRFEQATYGYTEFEHHGRNQSRQTGLDQVKNGSRLNQSIFGENKGQSVKTGKQLMSMILEPRKQQGNSQKQFSKTTVENIADRIKVYGNSREKARTKD